MPAQQLFLRVRGWICGRHKKPVKHVLETLALMVSGLIMGRSAQLWEIAVWIPWEIQLTSGVRRLERWLAERLAPTGALGHEPLRPPVSLLPPSRRGVVGQIAAKLAEALTVPNGELIQQIVAVIGPARALTYLAETLAQEAAGGVLTRDGSRRRTPGGAFFYRIRTTVHTKERWRIWPQDRPQATPPIVPLKWEERLEHLPALLAEPGVTMTAKLTLIGRPGRMIQAGDCVITTLQSSGKLPTLPKGLPEPPAKPTTFVVYIVAKQWRRVEQAMQDPNDALIVEGVPVYDERLPGLALLASSMTTKALQAAERRMFWPIK